MLDVLGPGDILGEVAAIDGLPRSATLTTLTAAEVLRIPAGDVHGPPGGAAGRRPAS